MILGWAILWYRPVACQSFPKRKRILFKRRIKWTPWWAKSVLASYFRGMTFTPQLYSCIFVSFLFTCSATSCLVASLPADLGRLKRAREERSVVGTHQRVAAVNVAELEEADNLSHNGLQLQVGKLLTNTSVTTSTKGKVWRGGTLGDDTVTVVNLLLFLIRAHKCGSIGRTRQPTVGIPLHGVGEVSRVGSTDNGGSQEVVGRRNDVFGSRNRHRRLDGTEDRVDGGVEAESLLDDGLVEGKLGEVLVGELGEVLAKGLDLLLVEGVHDLGVLGEAEHDPGAG